MAAIERYIEQNKSRVYKRLIGDPLETTELALRNSAGSYTIRHIPGDSAMVEVYRFEDRLDLLWRRRNGRPLYLHQGIPRSLEDALFTSLSREGFEEKAPQI